MRPLASVILCIVLAGGGCQAPPPPIDPATIEDRALLEINGAFVAAVEAAHDQPALEWHSGWTGNMWVSIHGAGHLGFCYHWQEWVYQEVIDTVEGVGWEACGVAVNVDGRNEHHAVVVFDPRRCRRERLLETPDTDPSFVLDGWRRGRPDLYTMADWLVLPASFTRPAELEELPSPVDLGLPFRPGDGPGR